MNRYVGKICPYCKTIITQTDEIVVCSACEMPHHKNCWVENRGCTTFGCLGTIQSPNIPEQSPSTAQPIQSQSYAHALQSVSPQGYAYAPQSVPPQSYGYVAQSVSIQNYGHAQQPIQSENYVYVPQNPPMQSYGYAMAPQAPAYVFVGSSTVGCPVTPKGEYYLPIFQRMRQQNTKASWNWAAFLFAPFWMMYRKMYWYGVSAVLVTVLCSLISSIWTLLLLVAGYAVFAVFANYLYLRWLEDIAVEASAFPPWQRTSLFTRKCGVSVPAAAISAAVCLLAVTVILLV